ncbi:MAG: hypothetical protein ACYCQJ_09585 [Nitrososphaerales archaeon]
MKLEIERHQELIDTLFKFPFVRYAVITDEWGKRYAGGMKPGVTSTTPVEIEKRLETQAVLILKMAEGYVDYDGKVLFSTIRWEKILAMFFLLNGNRTLSVTLEGDTFFDLISKVRETVENWKSSS